MYKYTQVGPNCRTKNYDVKTVTDAMLYGILAAETYSTTHEDSKNDIPIQIVL